MPETDYSELDRKRTLQHYLTLLVMRLNGDSIEEIAQSLKMERLSVQRDLEYVKKDWSRPVSPSGSAPAKPKESEFTLMDKWKIEATCSVCGTRITAGQDRLVIAALELTHKEDDFTTTHREKGVEKEQSSYRVVDVVGRRNIRHYCEGCSVKEPDFLISNPAFVQREVGTGTGQTPQKGAEDLETVKSDLAAGNTDSFNEAFPKNAPSKDAMARSTGMEAVGKRSGFGSSNLRVDPQSGEAAQRARMLLFLNEPASRGMRKDVRAVVRMWAEGASQNEVARKLDIDPSTVSRWIKSEQVKSNAPR